MPSPSPVCADTGVFILEVGGRQIGTEKFQIQPRGDKIEARAQIEFRVSEDGKDLEFRTFPDLILNSQLQPLTYNWNQQGAQSSRIRIDFRQNPTKVHYHTIHGRQDDREFNLSRNVMILDDNVVDQYELVAWRYAMTAGGNQTFPAFIPQEGVPGLLHVSNAGMETVNVDGRKESCRHLVVSTDLARIDLWVNSQQRLERMERAAGQFAAVRKM